MFKSSERERVGLKDGVCFKHGGLSAGLSGLGSAGSGWVIWVIRVASS